jgi:hypothetical protein
MNEYPKCLYLNGDVEAEYCVVADAAQELVKREEGYAVLGEEKAEPSEAPKKRGRPRKAE